MAKRRKLEAPSADDMNRIEEEFRRETPGPARSAPIAQVAAEAASAYEPGTAEDRASQARDEADASAYREATDQGLIILEIPIADVELLSIPRDRTTLDKAALDELEHSISLHGQRLPIEVYALPDAENGKSFGLLSGYRRLLAQQNLFNRTGMPGFAKIKAVLRDPEQMGGAFVAMVEENEIRQDLSHYERGRIAVIAAQQGAFHNTEEAVNEMFAPASKAKRSKIRSFAMIFEELGDVLNFPETFREKDGLRVAQALRGGADKRLREVLGTGQGVDAKSEWALIEAVLNEQSDEIKDPKRGGRPSINVPKSGWDGQDVLRTSTGVAMRYEADSNGYVIRFKGKGISAEVIEMLMLDIREKLEKF
jgi:ParB family chromosome partitioning protein